MQRAGRCLLVLLLGCSPEYELLRGPEAGQGAASGEPGIGGTGVGGVLEVGGTGSGNAGSETGGTGTAGEPSAGGESSAEGGTGMGAGTCTSHLDCGSGTLCNGSQCVACAAPPTSCSGRCDNGFEPVLGTYNGCDVCECAPVSACASRADCGAGQECYPGSQCTPGCSDPSCCRGNYCGAPGCTGLPVPHCLVAGCAGGAVCLAACDAVTCECDGATWQCAQSPSSGGAPGASCPQACVSP